MRRFIKLKKDKNYKLFTPFRERNIVLALIVILFLALLLGSLTYKEVQRERYYLWELARSEGLNIAFSIQTLGPRFILNENALRDILVLLKKEGVSYIDICNDKGIILFSTEKERWKNTIKILNPGKINFLNTQDKKGDRILEVIKPFNLDIDKQLDIWKILPIRNSYLVVGINLEGYYNRLSQTRRRIILNYSIIMALVLFGIYVIFKLQETYIVKKTLNEMKVYTSKLLETMDNAVISVDNNGNIKTFNRKSEEVARHKRLAALGKLSAGIAHEIRNPLSSIRGLAQFVYNSFSKTDERKEDLNTIIQEVDRLNKLVVQVLDFAKLKKPNLTRFSLNNLIRKITELFKIEIKDKQIKFNLKLSPNISQIQADEDQIKQILMNVIINAIQAIPKKGEIEIKTEKASLRGESAIKLIIEDSGIGITEKDFNQIFDPFFSTKEKGSGLGLSIVYKLVEAHQGEIKVESKEGKGTKFVIFLPQKGG